MAAQTHNPSQVQEFLGIIRRRAWQVLLPTALVLAIGIAVANFLPKSYKVTTRIALRESTLPGPGTGANALQRDIGSAAMMIKSPNRVREVVRRQEWQDYAGLSRQEQFLYEQRVLSKINVQVRAPGKLGGTAFISIDYTDADGQRAQRFLNNLRENYIEEEMQTMRERAESVLAKKKEVMLSRESAYQEVGKLLTDLKKSHQLSAATGPGQAGSTRGEDSVKVRLDRAREDLDAARRDLVAKQAKRETTWQIYQLEPLSIEVQVTTPKVTNDQELDAIDREIRDKRSQQDGLRPLNSTYRSLESDIKDLERERERLLATVVPEEVEGGWIPNPNRDALYKQVQELDVEIAGLAKQETSLVESIRTAEVRHEELQDVYAQQAMLANDMQNRQSAFNTAVEAFERQKTFVEVLEGPEANPFEVLEVAEATDVPTAPNVPAIIAFAAILGLGLGLGSALAAEYLKNGYRTVGEMTRSLAVPVLGAINGIVTRAEARRRFARRIMVGSSSALLIAAILWVTWAYKNKPLMLGPQITQVINELREQFR